MLLFYLVMLIEQIEMKLLVVFLVVISWEFSYAIFMHNCYPEKLSTMQVQQMLLYFCMLFILPHMKHFCHRFASFITSCTKLFLFFHGAVSNLLRIFWVLLKLSLNCAIAFEISINLNRFLHLYRSFCRKMKKISKKRQIYK